MSFDSVWEVSERLGFGRPLVFKVEEAARILRLGRRQAYEHIHSGRLRAVRNGNRLLIPVKALAEFLEGEPPAGVGGGR